MQNCSLLATNTLSVEAIDKSEIHFFGDAKIEVKKFGGEAKLFKKLK